MEFYLEGGLELIHKLEEQQKIEDERFQKIEKEWSQREQQL